MPVGVMTRLKRIHRGRCHYCDRETNKTPGSALQATKEHVVPRSYGGKNHIGNYVLACSGCNNKRGTQLWYCRCALCSTLIDAFLAEDKFIKYVFDQIIAYNKTRVYRFTDGSWTARRGNSHRAFDTWAEAMNYAEHGTFAKGE